MDFSNAAYLQKRGSAHSISNVTAVIHGEPKYLLDFEHNDGQAQITLSLHPEVIANSTKLIGRDYQDDGHQSSSRGGFKFNVYPQHPAHHLTVQYDWDNVWADVSDHTSDYMAYYNIDMAAVDMAAVDLNDYQPGG